MVDLDRFKADSALNRGQQGGRSLAHRDDAQRDELTAERHRLEQEFKEGIASGQFVPSYQPIMGLERRKVSPRETLCRCHHPARGVVTPDKFMAVAENSGLIGPLTFALLRAACRDMARFAPRWPRT